MAVIGNAPSVTLDHILVASDFTAASEAALAYAEALARRFSSRLTIANVVDLSIANRSEITVEGVQIDQMRHDSAENVERTVNQLSFAGLKVDGKSLEAHNPAARAVKLAEELQVDMLVIGTHSRHGFARFVLGSFAEGVIHHAKCPVLTVGPSVTEPDRALCFSTVVFATDLHHQTASKAAVALAFAEDSMGRIVLCHVLDHPASDLTDALEQQLQSEVALKKLIPNAAYDWCTPEREVEYGDPAERILYLARENSADLIVLGARRSSAWFSHFMEGVAGKVIEQAKCPVMTICNE